MRAVLYRAHGTSKAIGFMRHQRRDPADTAKNLLWIAKSRLKVISTLPPKAWTWVPMLIDLDPQIAYTHNIPSPTREQLKEFKL